jgi:hypothetical protein
VAGSRLSRVRLTTFFEPRTAAIDPEPTFSRYWPTKKMLRQVVEEVGTATTRRPGTQEFSSAPASFRPKLRP